MTDTNSNHPEQPQTSGAADLLKLVGLLIGCIVGAWILMKVLGQWF